MEYGHIFHGFYACICVGVVLCGFWRGRAIIICTRFIGSDDKGSGGNMKIRVCWLFTEVHIQETRDKSISK